MFSLAGGSAARAGPEKETLVDLLTDGAESPNEDHAGAPSDFTVAYRVGG